MTGTNLAPQVLREVLRLRASAVPQLEARVMRPFLSLPMQRQLRTSTHLANQNSRHHGLLP
jgi:hypothetical protein